VQLEELLAADRELVERAGDVLVTAGRGHVGEVLERATAADGHPRRQRPDLGGDGRERVLEPVAQRLPVAFRQRVAVHELGGQPGHPEVLARRPLEAGRVAHHDLEAAAAEVEAQRRRRFEQHAGAHRTEDQSRFGEAVDHLDLDPRLDLDAVDELVTVGGEAHRARGASRDLVDLGRVGEELHAPHRGDRLLGLLGRDVALAAHDVAEAQHLLLARERREAAVVVDLGDEEVERVRPEVECRDPHAGSIVNGAGIRSGIRTPWRGSP
jgi:hypothetical protein